jgi:hypothetical protein
MSQQPEILRHKELPKDFGRRFDLDELHDDRHGLRLRLRSQSEARLDVLFSDALSYRVSYEGDVPDLSSMLGHSPTGIVVLAGRGWLDERFGLEDVVYKNDKVIHWAIGGSNQIVEVVSTDEPLIRSVA